MSDQGTGIWAPARRRLTFGLLLVITLVALESLAVSTIMSGVARELGGFELYGWAFSAYFLGNLVGIVIAGSQADRFGPRRPLLVGAGLFATGLAIGGLAGSMEQLVVGRLVQGLGGAAIPTVAYVSIGRSYPETTRPRMFAALSTAWVVPGLAGPGLAGLVAETLGWRLVFLALIPFVFAGTALVLRSLRPTGPARIEPGEGGAPPRGEERRRAAAALLVAIGAGLLLAAGTTPRPLEAGLLAIAGAAVGLPFLRRLLPRGTLIGARGLPSVVLARGVATFAFFGAQAFVPLLLVRVRGLTLAEVGLVITAATITWTAGSWLQAHLVGRYGQARLIRVGFAVLTLGLGGTLALLAPAVPAIAGTLVLALAGFGMGLLYGGLAQLVLIEAPVAEHGAASSALQLSDVLGSALGTGVAGAFVAYGEAAGLAPAVGLGAGFALSVAAAIGGVVVAGRLHAGPGDRRSATTGSSTT